MFGLDHLFDNQLVGLALSAVLVLFIGAVGISIYLTFRNQQKTSANFTYVATVVAGLVLSVASGVLGTPASIQVSKPVSAASPASVSTQEISAHLTSDQISDFKTLYAWVYVIVGLVCLIVFISPTEFTHELVKGVGLTMLGFLITIVGGVSKTTNALQQQTLHVGEEFHIKSLN